jgi:hypothetical protein
MFIHQHQHRHLDKIKVMEVYIQLEDLELLLFQKMVVGHYLLLEFGL